MKIRRLISHSVANVALAAVACMGIYETIYAATDGYSLVESYQSHTAGVMYIQRETEPQKASYIVDGVPQIPPLPEEAIFDSRANDIDELDMLHMKLAQEG